MRFLTSSFRAKVLVGCILALLVTDVPLISFEILLDRKTQNETFQASAEQTTQTLARTVALPLWDFNYPFLDEIFAGLSSYDTIESAVLEDATGEVLASYATADPMPSTWADTSVVKEVVYFDGAETAVLGTLSIQFTGAPTVALAEEFARSRFGSFLFLIALASIALYITLGRVLQPLNGLVASIKRIEAGDLNANVDDIDRADEIGDVAVALEQLRQVEKKLKLDRERKDTATQQDRHRMLRALASTDDGVIVLDEAGAVILQNNRAAALLGKIPKGTKIAQIEALEDLARSVDQNGDAIRKITKDADEIALRIRKDAIRDEDGTELGQVILATDITEQLKQQERADFLAGHDGLTGLPNRRSLEQEMEAAQDGKVGLLLADLDRFKQINDKLGHAIGDDLLRQFATLLREQIDSGMIPVRLGGG